VLVFLCYLLKMTKAYTEAEVAEVLSFISSFRIETYGIELTPACYTCSVAAHQQHNTDKSCWLIIGNEKNGT
jgi:hypothetical protein